MEKRLQLWSPVWGWLATKEGESVDLKGQDLVLYETAIQEALEQEKLYYRKKSAPFNLMRCSFPRNRQPPMAGLVMAIQSMCLM